MTTPRSFGLFCACSLACLPAWRGIAAPGGLQLVFEQDGAVCGAYVNTTTYYKPWDVAADRRLPSGAPHGLAALDNFTVRGNGVLHVTKSGAYRFKTIADDGLVLHLNGRCVIDQPNYASGKEQFSEPIELEANRRYPISFRYREGTGSELCQIRLLDVAANETIWISGNLLEPVPEPWTFFGYGQRRAYGTVAYDATARVFELTGVGRGFMYDGDELDTLTLPTGTDDFVLQATCTVPQDGAAALVAHTSLTNAICPGVSLAIRRSGVTFAVRAQQGGTVKATQVPDAFAAGAQVPLRLTRRQGRLTLAFCQSTGVWTNAGEIAATGLWAGDLRVGPGVFSRSQSKTETARFSRISFVPVSVTPELSVTREASGALTCRVMTGTDAERRQVTGRRLGSQGWWWSDACASAVAGWTVTVTEAAPEGAEEKVVKATVPASGTKTIDAWQGDTGVKLSVSATASSFWSLGLPRPVLSELTTALEPVAQVLNGKGLWQAIYKSWQDGPSAATPDATLIGTLPGAWSVTDGPYVTDAGQSVDRQNFYSLWQGNLSVPVSGYYKFRQSYVNGCAKLSLGGTDVFTAFDRVTGTRTDESGWIRLTAGRRYPFQALWRKGNGADSGSFSFACRRDGEDWAPLPKEWLSTTRTASSPVRLDRDGVFGAWRDYDIGTSIPGNSILEGTLSTGGRRPDAFDLTFLASSGEGSFDNGLTTDAIHFLAKPMDGDFLIEANVSLPTGYNGGKGVWRRLGLCVRESPTAANARCITAVRSYADGRLMAQMRNRAGAALTTFFSRNLGTGTARIGLERLEGKLNVYIDGRKVATRSLDGWPERLYVGFAGSSWAKEHQAVAFFQNCRVKKQIFHGFFISITEPQPDPLPFTMEDFAPVYKATVLKLGKGAVRLQMPSAEWSTGALYSNSNGVDLSQGRYLAADVENLSTTRQMRLTMHVSAGGVITDSDDHAAAILAQNRSVNTGIALNPGEKGTMMLLLPHVDIYGYPDGAKGVYTIDTHHVTDIAFKIQWPYENEFKGLVDCKVSNLRLVSFADKSRAVPRERYLPFVDNYGQFIHDKWSAKVTNDVQLVEDLVRERAELKPAPATWDEYGGWANGPQRTATGHFRTEKVDGRWWFVTPSGHLFFSFGMNVARTMTDASSGPAHPAWYADGVNKRGSMSYTLWNLQKKFGTSAYTEPYYDFLLDRFDSWGINTIGNWSAGDLCRKGRKPYVCTIYSRDSSVPSLPNYSWYDCLASDFGTKMKAAVKANAEKDPALKKALTDPMCIGFFIDNEPGISGAAAASGGDEKEFYRAYFKACREAIKAIAPNKLYLGCRLVGYRQSSYILSAAGEFCDVVSINGYCNSIYNVQQGLLTGNGFDKPILHGEFHFGCIDRGMFSAGLCPVGTQAERARSLTRFMQGALVHPNIIGAHWFQYRDQPLQGRGDGEAYQVGFVDVCDRTYPWLTRAAREVGENMYDYRQAGRLKNSMK